MNKRNSLFSPSAYLESLRQTRLTGLIYLVCCLLFSFLPALISSVSGSSFAPNLVDYAGVLFAYIYLAPLTLVLSSFGFLTRRSASDFYHSLPIRRSTLYVSRVLAILTWLAGTVVLSLLSSYLTYGLFGRVLNWAQLPYLIGYFFSCCLLVTACALIGICSTGTYFSAFIVAGLVMFLPRFISFLIAEMVESSAPIVSVAELGFLFNYNLNLPVALIAELFSFGFYGAIDLDVMMVTGKYIGYTALLGLIYLAAAGVIFCRRASETASKSAPSRVMQHLFRCAISLPLFLVSGMMLVFSLRGEWHSPGLLVLLICAAVLVYFIYELVTTRRVRNLLSALYVLPIVLAVSIGVPFLGEALGRQALHTIPAPSEIESLRFDERDGSSAYNSLLLSRIDYRDEEISSLVVENLSSTASAIEKNSHLNPFSETVVFNLKSGRTITRRIHFSPADAERLQELKSSFNFYQTALTRLPDEQEIHSIFSNYGLTDKDCREIWNSFRSEYEALAPEKQRLLQNGTPAVSNVPLLAAESAPSQTTMEQNTVSLYDGFLNVQGVSGIDTFASSYNLTTLTPKTMLLFLQKINRDDQNTAEALLEAANMLKKANGSEVWIGGGLALCEGAQIRECDLGYNLLPDMSNASYHESLQLSAELLELLASADTSIDNLNEPFVLMRYLNIEVIGSDGASWNFSCRAYRLTPAQEAAYRSLTHRLEALSDSEG